MRLSSGVRTSSPEFRENQAYHETLSRQLEELLAEIRQGGGTDLITAQHQKGKLTARERIEELTDSGTSFLELSPLAGYQLYEDRVPAGGIISGVGQIAGRLCMIVANDQTVKGGTYYPITVRKHLRAQEIAWKNHLPCIYLVDSGGAFLPMQDEVFPDRDDFGRIFYNQAQMSAAGIPQIASVHGFCTAGGAYIPAMSDQSVIVRETGTIFLAGPPLVRAATGEDVSAEELGGAHVHTSISGVADHLAENDRDALFILRDIISHLGKRESASVELQSPVRPFYDPSELGGLLPAVSGKAIDIREVIARLVDGSELFEFKKNYGSTLVTGFAHLGGIPVGILGNNGVLFSESALKGTHFIELCCQEKIPLLFLQNITGFMVGKQYEQGGIAKHGAKLVHAVANAAVPKLTLIIGGSFGAGNYGMCGRAYDPDYLFMWPQARISVMGGAQAADVLCTVKRQQAERKGLPFGEEDEQRIRQPVLDKYEREGHAYYSSARLWDDGVIYPSESRSTLIQALASCLHKPLRETRNGIFRM
ncbi:MAG: methylcrotonoyl-CoA carboxylase [Deltaproteobacteria bacterium]|nr:methylcrotonoyl-CoA carboxylase [Deltaproteobacteria bacterium]